MSSAYTKYLTNRVDRTMRVLYPDVADRSMAYASMAAEAAEAYLFGNGEMLESLVVMPAEEEGYYIEATTTEEVEQ